MRVLAALGNRQRSRGVVGSRKPFRQKGIILFKDSTWYVVRTKQYKERVVAQSVLPLVDDIYVPLLRTKRRALGRFIERIEPLFPCYVFARLTLAISHHKLTRRPGVLGIVCLGGEPAEVDERLVQGIKSRERDGLIVLPVQRFQPRQPVTISDGVLRGMDAVFERYLSGTERVAVLLNTIGGAHVRAILRGCMISPSISRDVA
jgi:transcriptional antiterminator RfaH